MKAVWVWLSPPESGGRNIEPTKNHGATITMDNEIWSMVIHFDNDPKFSMWNKAKVRGTVDGFPGVQGTDRQPTAIYEGSHVIGWVKKDGDKE